MSNLSAPKPSLFVRKTNPQTSPQSQQQQQPQQPQQQQNVLNIAGTKTSLQNNQLLTPIGIPSIDFFLGGGLPVGSICLIGEDKHNSYADIVTRCFLAEGVTHKHSLFVATTNETRDELFKRIPSVNRIETKEEAKNDDNEALRIAWRYGSNKPASSADETTTSKLVQPNYFLMNKFMSDEEVYAASSVETFEAFEASSNESIYGQLESRLLDHIDKQGMNILKTKKYTNIMRIGWYN